jgi:phenylalanyl-tRNA synthetase beta chain
VDTDAETGALRCTVPARRVHDITREVDVIEEVARLHGFDHMQVAPTLPVQLELNHPRSWDDRERATDEIGRVMTSAGFYETVTFSFLTKHEAEPFVPEGMRLLSVDPERRREAPYLRPSLVPSLLQVRRLNQDARVHPEGGVRLFEVAAVFAELNDGERLSRQTQEHRTLGVLLDVPDPPSKKEQASAQQDAMRLMRGSVNSVVRALHGGAAEVDLRPTGLPMPAFRGQVGAAVVLGEQHLGYIGMLDGTVLETFGLERAVVVAELGVPHLLALYPPRTHVHTLPAFPGIERDVSLVLDEGTPWADVHKLIADVQPDKLVAVDYVTTFRGKPIEQGRKSVTARLTFRDPERTLRHDEVDPQVDAVVERAKRELNAELRA